MVRPHPRSNNLAERSRRPLPWVLYCGAGSFLGIAVAATTIFLLNEWLGDTPDNDARMLALSVMLLAGVAEGALIGLFQWRILRKLLPGITAKSWLGITILAAVIGWGLGMMPATWLEQQATQPTESSLLWQMVAGGIGTGLVVGALFGLMQNMVLKHFVANQWQWPLYNMLGWGLAMEWIVLGAIFVDPSWPLPATIAVTAIAGGLGGLTLGGITAIFLIRRDILNPR